MNSQIQHYIDLIIVLTQKEMKIRYKSSFLGYVWSILNPLAFAFIFFVIFVDRERIVALREGGNGCVF